MIPIDLTNIKFNYWTVLERAGSRNKGSVWKCKCICGNIKDITRSSLISKNSPSKSCGCFLKKKIRERCTTHGFSCDDLKKRFYKSWQAMKQRCDNPKCKSYKNYGSRNITYVLKWKDFLKFKDDMYFEYMKCKLKYKTKLSIERKDVNKNYCKENCTFIPLKDQSKNRRCVINKRQKGISI